MPTGEKLKKPELAKFVQDSKVSDWLKNLHPNSRSPYKSALFILCQGLNVTGSELLHQCETNAKEMSIRVKSLIKSLNGTVKQSTLAYRLAAMKNFLDFYEVEPLPLAGLRIKAGRAEAHPQLKWADAERIISLAPSAYQPVYRLMMWGLDAERFTQLNNDEKVLANVKEQLKDRDQPFIRIPAVNGRKGNASPYYVMVPRAVAEYLPIRKVKGRTNITKYSIQDNWRTALLRAGLPIDRKHGAHNLRSAWMDEATYRGLDAVLREFQLGHSVDPLNYSRVTKDLDWVMEQFVNAWRVKPTATKEELAARDQKIRELQQQIDDLKAGRGLSREDIRAMVAEFTAEKKRR
jgi:hypothetical protein